jgi:hypothetical protein
MGHVWVRRPMHKCFLKGNLKNIDHLEDLCFNETIILKQILKKHDGRLCTGLI